MAEREQVTLTVTPEYRDGDFIVVFDAGGKGIVEDTDLSAANFLDASVLQTRTQQHIATIERDLGVQVSEVKFAGTVKAFNDAVKTATGGLNAGQQLEAEAQTEERAVITSDQLPGAPEAGTETTATVDVTKQEETDKAQVVKLPDREAQVREFSTPGLATNTVGMKGDADLVVSEAPAPTKAKGGKVRNGPITSRG